MRPGRRGRLTGAVLRRGHRRRADVRHRNLLFIAISTGRRYDDKARSGQRGLCLSACKKWGGCMIYRKLGIPFVALVTTIFAGTVAVAPVAGAVSGVGSTRPVP